MTFDWDDLSFDQQVDIKQMQGRVPFGVELRTVDDALSLRAVLDEGVRVIVVGAGFIGCEVAASARQLGVEVDLVEALPFPLARTLGALVGAYCADLHRSHGVRAHLGVAVDGLV
ncbi:MAG: FAD-dependent oxidoreductase, partial [Nitrospiraceae bacterium]|nr:FAD-dependent oxidoreductase [Nitrospiraceae bacterium]